MIKIDEINFVRRSKSFCWEFYQRNQSYESEKQKMELDDIVMSCCFPLNGAIGWKSRISGKDIQKT